MPGRRSRSACSPRPVAGSYPGRSGATRSSRPSRRSSRCRAAPTSATTGSMSVSPPLTRTRCAISSRTPGRSAFRNAWPRNTAPRDARGRSLPRRRSPKRSPNDSRASVSRRHGGGGDRLESSGVTASSRLNLLSRSRIRKRNDVDAPAAELDAERTYSRCTEIKGRAILFYSSDTDEMAHLCHRVLLLRRTRNGRALRWRADERRDRQAPR
jgi:hypothetical protein